MARYVEFNLGGQVRQFRLTTAALEKLERELGLSSFTELVRDDEGKPSRIQMSARITNAILWLGLLWKEPALTKDTVMGWIDGAEYAECMTKAIEIYGAALETFATANPQTGGPAGTGTPPDAPPSGSA